MSWSISVLKRLVLPSLLVLSWAAVSSAQFRGGFGGFGGGPGGPGPMSKLMLLGSEQVRKELKVTDEQKTKIDEAQAAARERLRGQFGNFQDFQNLTQEEREKRFAEFRERGMKAVNEDNAKVETILSGEQVTRLNEISLQIRGVAALAEEGVTKELNLTEDQKQKIQSAFQSQRTKQEELFRGVRDIPAEEREQKFAEMREKNDQLRKETESTVLGVLTAEQKDVFELMKGEKFELDMRSLFPGGGRPGGDRGGRPGGDRNRRPRTEDSDTKTEA
jgi:Spy/CpxP family protein refolding chaperone